MITKGNFLLLELNEFRDWLKGQSITRKISKLQVHHTWKPNYSTRKNQDHFKCLEGMRNSHVKDRGFTATAQNITIFEDGKVAISLDRNLNQTPAGIGYANTGALCIEIIGNFDKDGDSITDIQKQAIAHVYACLCEKLNIKPITENLPYHCWYDAKGNYMGDYSATRSAKSCPGTNFLGVGNTKLAALDSFIPLVQNELKRLKGEDEPMTAEERKQFEEMQKQLIQVEAPAWFVKEFGQDFIEKNMSNPKMIPEGWRSLAIALRAIK